MHVRELKQEMINSERLKDHFKEAGLANTSACWVVTATFDQALGTCARLLVACRYETEKNTFGNKRKRKRKKTNNASNYTSASQRKQKNTSLTLCSPLHMNLSRQRRG